MERAKILGDLELAQTSVCVATENVSKQRKLVAHLDGSGLQWDAARARGLLITLEVNLAMKVKDRDRIAQELIEFERLHLTAKGDQAPT